MTGFIETWLHHAIRELSVRDTPDPAGVAAPVQPNRDRDEVVGELDAARQQFGRALMYEREGYDLLALDALATFFDDDQMMPRPDQDAVRTTMAERFKEKQRGDVRARADASTTTIAARVDTRSWSC